MGVRSNDKPMSDNIPDPTAEGTLGATPFAHLLLYVQQNQLSGTLVVWPELPGLDDNFQDRILFSAGMPVAGRLLDPASTLELGLLPLFSRESSPFAFYSGIDLVGEGSDVLRSPIDTLALLAAALRGAFREDAIAGVLAHYDGVVLRLRPGLGLKRFGFNSREEAFIDVIRAGPASIRELVAASPDTRLARRLIYLLATAKILEPYTSKRDSRMPPPPATGSNSGDPITLEQDADDPPSALEAAIAAENKRRSAIPPSRKSVVPPPTSLPPGLNEFWTEIVKRSGGIEHENYFQMLGIPRDANGQAARDAYMQLVKKWHPDRTPKELESLKPQIEQIFHYLTQAKDTLLDDDKRLRYLRMVQEGGGTPAEEKKVQAIVQASVDYQKAEVLARRRDYDGTLKLLESAIELNPDEADYHALWAFTLHSKYPGADAPFERMIAAVDRALSLNDAHERSHFYKATILKRMGDESLAYAHFKRAAQLNPRNIDAVREVRLASMRSSKAPRGGSMRPSMPPSKMSNAPGARSLPPSRTPPPATGAAAVLSRLFGSKKK